MLNLWGKFKKVIEENEKEHQRLMEIRDPEESTVVPIYARDYILQFDHLVIFESILAEYMFKTTSFKAVEQQLNSIFERVADNLEEEIRTDVIPLHYENKKLSLTKEFDPHSPPFHFFLDHHGLETETRVSAIELNFLNKELLIKNVMLNDFDDSAMPYFVRDSYPVMPSNLTMFLKYAIRNIDESKLQFYDNRDYMLWERNFQTMALMFDFIRQHKDYRSQVTEVIVKHCSDCYKIPKDIAAALKSHVTEHKTPYHSSEFNISVEFVPADIDVQTNGLAGSLTVFYF